MPTAAESATPLACLAGGTSSQSPKREGVFRKAAGSFACPHRCSASVLARGARIRSPRLPAPSTSFRAGPRSSWICRLGARHVSPYGRTGASSRSSGTRWERSACVCTARVRGTRPGVTLPAWCCSGTVGRTATTGGLREHWFAAYRQGVGRTNMSGFQQGCTTPSRERLRTGRCSWKLRCESRVLRRDPGRE